MEYAAVPTQSHIKVDPSNAPTSLIHNDGYRYDSAMCVPGYQQHPCWLALNIVP